MRGTRGRVRSGRGRAWPRPQGAAICRSGRAGHGPSRRYLQEPAGRSAEVVTSGGLAALSPANICNTGARRRGVQLEVTRGLRDMLLAQPQGLVDFAQTVRRAIA